jgi:hypothetical protein
MMTATAAGPAATNKSRRERRENEISFGMRGLRDFMADTMSGKMTRRKP